MNNFEKATKLRLRFPSAVGFISTEDIWQLPLPELNKVAKQLNKALKENAEESFIENSTKDDTVELAFEIVKHVIKCKLEDKEKLLNQVANKARKEQILRIMAAKQDDQLNSKSIDELAEELSSL